MLSFAKDYFEFLFVDFESGIFESNIMYIQFILIPTRIIFFKRPIFLNSVYIVSRFVNAKSFSSFRITYRSDWESSSHIINIISTAIVPSDSKCHDTFQPL